MAHAHGILALQDQTIRTRQLIILDDAGNPRVTLAADPASGGGMLGVMNGQGELVGYLHATTGGDGSFGLRDRDGRPVATLQRTDAGGRLDLFNADGGTAASMTPPEPEAERPTGSAERAG